MNQRFVSVLIFAFVMAAGASLLLYRLLGHRGETRPAALQQQVVVAARNLDPGTLIKEQDLGMGPWLGPLPAGALTKKDDIVGRGVRAGIVDHEPILESRLAPRGAGAGLSSMIPARMRAVAIRVNEVAGVGGFVAPGMRVDILISGTPPDDGSGLGNLTKTMLQNIEVLSAGQDFRRDAEGKPISVAVVNLLVTPEQAERLSLAANRTMIQLVLRNPLDTRTTDTPGAAMANLFGNRFAAPLTAGPRQRQRRRAASRPALVPIATAQSLAPEPRDPAPLVLETINGAKRSETRFQESS